MTAPASTITLDVDATNPGQFLACCGLLELASQLDAQAVGWFELPNFCLALNQPDRLRKIADCPLARISVSTNESAQTEEKSPPVQLGSPFGLILDWWEDNSASRAGFKTWAGGQTVMGFIDGMRQHVPVHTWQDLFHAIPLKKPKPFCFDSRLSRLTSLDLGFSPQKFTTVFSPTVELFALIGMQRFRPTTVVPRERFAFATWKEPLPASIAAAVASCLIPTLIDRRYQFPLVVRTGDKYKAFGPAILERIFHD